MYQTTLNFGAGHQTIGQHGGPPPLLLRAPPPAPRPNSLTTITKTTTTTPDGQVTVTETCVIDTRKRERTPSDPSTPSNPSTSRKPWSQYAKLEAINFARREGLPALLKRKNAPTKGMVQEWELERKAVEAACRAGRYGSVIIADEKLCFVSECLILNPSMY